MQATAIASCSADVTETPAAASRDTTGAAAAIPVARGAEVELDPDMASMDFQADVEGGTKLKNIDNFGIFKMKSGMSS